MAVFCTITSLLEAQRQVQMSSPLSMCDLHGRSFRHLTLHPLLGPPGWSIFRGFRAMVVEMPPWVLKARSVVCFQSSYVVGLHYSLYANPPFFDGHRQVPRTNGCLNILP